MTFDVEGVHQIARTGWQQTFEVFCICRHCKLSTVFRTRSSNPEFERTRGNEDLALFSQVLNQYYDVLGFVGLKDLNSVKAPEHVPESIVTVFDEGATCLQVECWNAAATMFRLCVDLATKPLLPDQDRDGLNNHIRRTLGARLNWLFDNRILPEALRSLSTCIREDGNDGAHEGSLTKSDSEDLLDFTVALLERLYTEPERIRLAGERRDSRRSGGAGPP
jgi:hypothetical protein